MWKLLTAALLGWACALERGLLGGPLLTAAGAAAEKAVGAALRQRYTRPGGCTDRKAAETKAFRSRMASALGRVNISEDGAPLADWWNIYDELAVQAQGAAGSLVNSSDLQQAEELVAWLEATKFGPKLAGAADGQLMPWLPSITRHEASIHHEASTIEPHAPSTITYHDHELVEWLEEAQLICVVIELHEAVMA
eukprot:Skav209568  [mRNA]  locus=scaffold281:87991:96130:- [translate_table: standard]